jgi:hypothetical protein
LVFPGTTYQQSNGPVHRFIDENDKSLDLASLALPARSDHKHESELDQFYSLLTLDGWMRTRLLYDKVRKNKSIELLQEGT